MKLKILLVPAAALALAATGCDRGGTPARPAAPGDGAVSAAPAPDAPPASTGAEAAAPAAPSAEAPASAGSAPALPSDRMPSAPPPESRGNADGYADCLRSAARAKTTDERLVLERTCARMRPR